ncbi:putative bifunctional diguanylate cyclase/phosphodiesterase [Micromonosporaceae bacterium Da 78-11]
MAGERSYSDDTTEKRLWLLIGLVVVSAAGAAAWSAVTLATTPAVQPNPWLRLGLVTGIALAGQAVVLVRLQSDVLGVNWTGVAVTIGLFLLPARWVVLCTLAAILLPKLISQTPPQQTLFAAAKETMIAFVGGGLLLVVGFHPEPVRPIPHVGLIAAVVVAMWIVDEVISVPIMATVTHRSIRQMFRINLRLRIVVVVGHFLVSALVITLLAFNGDVRMLLFVPPVVLCLHLWQAGNQRRNEERKSWQRLAETTDELNVVELDAVLHSAAVRAAQLFAADQAEIELVQDDRLVRGTAHSVGFDGPVGEAPAGDPHVVTTQLSGYDGNDPIGVLRVGFRQPIGLNVSETYKLKAFASALYTAIRNAKAYAELERIAAVHAHAATHDSLTGLPNRRQLYDRATQAFHDPAHAGTFALLLIDLNHFKEVNDTLGHASGDKVLREIARRLRAKATPGDLVARLGGDEFAVILTDLPTPALASHRAGALFEALEAPVEVDGMHLTVEAAGGIALAPGTGGIDELLRRADVAMYQAKRAGQQTATYAHSQDTTDVDRLMLGGELRRAVTEHEFVVDFQPIVDLGSGEVISAEALARWRHPQHGYLTPMQFLETVERSGQLPAFADAVLDQALTAAGIWREAGFDLPIAVNVSPRSLLDPTFPATVLARLRSHDVPADRLTLELAETLTISQLDVVGRTLDELREAGVRLALDDFGTGVSPLSVLSHIPVHQLKIDREFVGAVETSSEAAAVIRSTVDLARSLQLTVIAEGVESEPQRHALWELGCVAGQGHLFARPMSSARLLGTLHRGSGGRPGVLAGALHDAGAVVRMPRRRSQGHGRSSLPHLPA